VGLTLLLGAGNGTGRLPGGIGSHAAQAALPKGSQSVVELPPHFQVRTQACGLPRLDRKGQFKQKRRRLLFGVLALPTWRGIHQPSAFQRLAILDPRVGIIYNDREPLL